MSVSRGLAVFGTLLALAGAVALLSGSLLLGLVILTALVAVALSIDYLAWEKGMFGERAGEPGAGNEAGAVGDDVVLRTATIHSSTPDGGGGGF